MQCTAWIFTINNPTGLLDPEDAPNVRFMVYQEEQGESGTDHLQGYVEFTRSVRLSTVKSALGDKSAHCEPRKGSQLEAIQYCTKRDSRIDGPYYWGTPSGGQGARNDLTEIKKKVDEGKAVRSLWDDHFGSMVRYHVGIEKYRNMVESQKARGPTLVSLYYGPTGTGKSFSAGEVGEKRAWVDAKGDFIHGMDPDADTIILDDFRGGLEFKHLLRLLDRYPYSLNVKGGSIPCRFTRVIITSNLRPDQWYKQSGRYDLGALVRRIHNWVWFWDRCLEEPPLKFKQGTKTEEEFVQYFERTTQ